MQLVDLLASGVEFAWVSFARMILWLPFHSDSNRSSLFSPLPFLLSSSLPVAIAKLVVAVTISLAGFHLVASPSLGSPDHHPRKYKVSPQRRPANRRISPLKIPHRGHLNRR